MGAVTTYTEARGAEICERLSQGETLSEICRSPGMPGRVTVYRWGEADPEFAERIARARNIGFDAIAEQALEIANTPVPGKKIETSKDGKRTVTEDALGHRRLQVETRLKLLAKWSPKKYGERLGITDGEGGPLRVVFDAIPPDDAP
jgi:hypothetical protein